MTTIKCDGCGVETSLTNIVKPYKLYADGDAFFKQRDFCDSCWSSIRRVIIEVLNKKATGDA